MIEMELNINTVDKECGHCDALCKGKCIIFSEDLKRDDYGETYEKSAPCKVAFFNFDRRPF